jgi:ADP-ribose pyrophosphatase YjhB (NUDIX family)/predicted transcriptional regulator
MNEEHQRILKKIMHAPGLTFNDLWEKEGESNKFAYHLRVLEEDGLAEKSESGYVLTHKGKRYATYIDGETGRVQHAPLIGTIIVIYDEKVDKFLMMRREKEPFYGYWGFHGGKLKFDQYILDCAKEEVKQETGLECQLEMKGIFSSKTYNNGELSYNHQMFVVKATNPQGTLLERTREGENRWVSKEEMKILKTFPNVPYSVEIALGTGFRWVEADRTQENDEFTGMKLLKNQVL